MNIIHTVRTNIFSPNIYSHIIYTLISYIYHHYLFSQIILNYILNINYISSRCMRTYIFI